MLLIVVCVDFSEPIIITLSVPQSITPSTSIKCQRKFVRVDDSSSRPGELHKRFQSWLSTTYHDGKPSDDETALIMEEDE